ncbi:hypothetical protein KAH51_06330 [Proteus vulgaris]|uniref:hypothetical protein n=1 Tax=Proteus vulgaris TaxID=585 RepID=UPI001B38FD7B|nr:hypothetical protein [Proteus vulgaris]MBQ0213079.1 hypothetical protein [Proteus vulgaris]
MKIELAKSLELNRDITAEDADKLFSENRITSKHLFECTEPDCHAQVTCANLDKPSRLRKRVPYFKFVSEHSDACKIGISEESEFRKIKKAHEDPEALPFILDDTIELDLSSPYKNKIHDVPVLEEDNSIKKRLKRKDVDEENINKTRHTRKRLSGLVNAFINKENFFLNTAEGRIHLRDFFIHVNDKKDLSEYIDEPRVYFGKAWIKRIDNYYLVRFNNEMRAGNLKCKPTFFITERLVDSSEYKRTSRQELDKIAFSKPVQPLYLFIFSELPPVKMNSSDFINFKLDDLTYLYYKKWGKKNE